MNRMIGFGIAICVAFFSADARAENTEISVALGFVSVIFSDVFMGTMLQGNVEFEVAPGLFVGGQIEQFKMESNSSDYALYDRHRLRGLGIGPTFRMSSYPASWLETYILVRAQIYYGERGSRDDLTTHITVMPGGEFGMMLRSGAFRGGLSYFVDVPTVDFENFGGIRHSIMIPNINIGLVF